MFCLYTMIVRDGFGQKTKYVRTKREFSPNIFIGIRFS